MEDAFRFAGELGPAKIIHVHEPSIGLRGTLVVDNVARGPAIGGLRMAVDVGTEECFRLARAMTMKNAAAGLAHGGGKSVLRGDPHMRPDRKEAMIRAFAHALRNEADYVFGPDMGTDEGCMAWIEDEIGRAVGLPEALGGIPLDALGATGFGIRHAAEVAAPYCKLDLRGARVAVQGFGAVGKHAARFLAAAGCVLVGATGFGIRHAAEVAAPYCKLELRGARVAVQGFGAVGKHAARFLVAAGCVLVGASDSRGAIRAAGGLDVEELARIKQQGGSVRDYARAEKLDGEAILDVECDIWIPAARPDVVREENAGRLRTRLVLEGANIPFTVGAERMLHDRGVLVVPDFIANAGGVICAAMEYHGATRGAAFEAIAEKIRANTKAVLDDVASRREVPREAAVRLATERVRAAMATRRFSIM